MNILMIPFLMMTTITQIKVSETQIIKSQIISPDQSNDIKQKLLALTPENFILIKGIVESIDSDCKDILADSVEACNVQIDNCWSSCNTIPSEQKNLIRVLKLDVEKQKKQIKKLKRHNKIYNYVAVALGSVAIASSTYIILK